MTEGTEQMDIPKTFAENVLINSAKAAGKELSDIDKIAILSVALNNATDLLHLYHEEKTEPFNILNHMN